MFDMIRKFVGEVTDAEEPTEMVHSQQELAQAALMYSIIAVDGVIRREERERMAEILTHQFELTPEETAHLADAARDAEHEAIDLYKFTSKLVHALEEEERIRIVENLWEMVFADGVVHELEDNAVWRIAELLGVSSRDRMNLKQRVWERTNGGGAE